MQHTFFEKFWDWAGRSGLGFLILRLFLGLLMASYFVLISLICLFFLPVMVMVEVDLRNYKPYWKEVRYSLEDNYKSLWPTFKSVWGPLLGWIWLGNLLGISS